MYTINASSKKVYSEPTSSALKPYVVEYVHFHIDQAKKLSEDELLHGQGNDIASSICGALAWQGAKGVEGEDWITKDTEPILWKILELASPLDRDADNLKLWQELFATAERL
jgi:hypothetical protein